MKNYMRSLVVLAALLFGAVNEVWGQSVTIADFTNGSISKSVDTGSRTVTLTVTPDNGYYISASDIKVEPLVDPNNANVPNRRVPDLANQIVGKMYNDATARAAANIINSISGQNAAYYVFEVPAQYDGVYVTATFTSLTSEETIITGSTTSVTYSATGKYVLTDDVDAAVLENLYTGSQTTDFSGTLEGVAKADGTFPVIKTLNQPLFYTATNATINNIILDEVNISQSGKVGSIACIAKGATRIYNCGILSGSVGSTGTSTANNSTDCCGGLVGELSGTARVINCYSYAKITSGNRVAGIVGYNNETSNSTNITTMVMNCMFYGDITGGSKVSPVYGGKNINNLQDKNGLNTFNFYAFEKLKSKKISASSADNTDYNCALAIEDRYLTRFEIYRQLLNSNKKLAAYYITGRPKEDAGILAKWVLETADRSINGRVPYPYPILKAQGYYPSIINPDFENAPDSTTVGRNHGGKLPSPRRTLSVTISGSKTTGGQDWPSGASITRTYLDLVRTDMDGDRFNFNYDKVQLPYYNDVGTGNYTGGKVVTGWKITSITGGTAGTYTKSDSWGGYNFADRNCTNKDLYSVSERVFSQGAYWDVPYGVTAITIEPYWGYASFVADEYYDVVYTSGYGSKTGRTVKQVESTTIFNGKSVKTNVNDALGTITTKGSTVYDNAVVLVGNFHQANINNTDPYKGSTPFTLMSVDLDHDNEPDYSLIFHDNNRSKVCPIRFDFLNIPGTAQAQKPNATGTVLNASVFNASAWFEITNTCNIYFSQFEYENSNKTAGKSPIILLGGVYDQFTSTKVNTVQNTTYLHVGGNAWFKDFANGTHSDGTSSTKHIPISVTGGEYKGFYLTGTYSPSATVLNDDAECYVSGGHFIEAAGAGQEQIGGNVQWQIYNADIDNFYGGGINAGKPIKGNITVDIINSHVGTFCGGPKFGDMQTINNDKKKVTTNATGCTFGKFFGAGYGGTAISRVKYYDLSNVSFNTWQEKYYKSSDGSGDRGKYFDGVSTNASYDSGKNYGKKGLGVATDFDYEFFIWTSGTTGGRFFVKFASFSLAQCNYVESNLKKCVINENFYGGGSLGKVAGDVKSTLEDCEVKGNVYGAGFSASYDQVDVRDAGFASNGSGGYLVPSFNKYSGMFEPGTPSGTTKFDWRYAGDDNVTLANGNSGSNLTSHIVYADKALTNANLGSVAGNVNLTIKGDSKIGTDGVNDKKHGHVFGGGESSWVTGADHKVTVNLQGNTEVLGNVFGGGDNGVVEGSTEVKIEE